MNKHQQRLKKERHKSRMEHKVTYRDAETALSVLMVLPIYILHNKYGFGNKRCMDFMKEFHRLYRCVSKGEVSVQTLINSVDAETGLLYDMENFELINRRDSKCRSK